MRPKRRMRPGIDALESKLLLSQAPARLPAPVVQEFQRRHHAPGAEGVALRGAVDGTFSSSDGIPDAGAMQTLQGAGAVAPLGTVRVRGELSLPGFILHGRSTGSFTLTNSAGSVTIHVTGEAHGGRGTLPHTTVGRFTIIGGSGAYAAAAGSGRAVLTETPERRPTPHPGGPTPDFIVAATFTLTLEAAAGMRGS